MTGGHGVDIASSDLQQSAHILRFGRGRTDGDNCVMTGIGLKACVLSAALALAGCAALPGGGPSPLDTFDLTAPTPQVSATRTSRRQILIAEPSALKVHDGENIVIRTSAASVEFLGGAQWADRLPRIVQSRLVEAFQSTGRLGGVGKPGEGLAIDYQVVTEIRAFEIRVDGAPRAQVRLFVKLLNDRNGVVLAAREFESTVSLGSTSGNGAYVAALDRAFSNATNELVNWGLGAI